MMGLNTRNMYSCLQKCNKLNKSHIFGQLLNLIHVARTHVYKIPNVVSHVQPYPHCRFGPEQEHVYHRTDSAITAVVKLTQRFRVRVSGVFISVC